LLIASAQAMSFALSVSCVSFNAVSALALFISACVF
jgi:hypothetical protein